MKNISFSNVDYMMILGWRKTLKISHYVIFWKIENL